MSHPAQREFFARVRAKLPDRFVGADVLDVGSLDVNGNNRWLFTNSTYTGIDLQPGRNVDFACLAHKFFPPIARYPGCGPREFDVVISSEALEHDRFWRETLRAFVRLCKPGGLVLFSCAGPGRPEHGTKAHDPEASPFTTDYYCNLTAAEVRAVLDFGEVEQVGNDLYFWGITASGR